LTKIKELLDQEIRDVFGPDAPIQLFEEIHENGEYKSVSPREIDVEFVRGGT
jgi:hypothetical protein